MLAWCESKGQWIAFALAVVCYLNVLPNDFANDGGPIIQVSDKVNLPGQWRIIWTTDYWSKAEEDWKNRDLLYRPMAVSTYRLVRILFGTSALPHHIINILLHGLASALIVRLCRRVNMTSLAALAAGAVFAVLPIHTEVLGNIVGRADLLATGGMLTVLLTHYRMINAPSVGNAAAWGFASAVAAFVAMSSKESAVALVGILGLFDLFWIRNKFGGRAPCASKSVSDEVSATITSNPMSLVNANRSSSLHAILYLPLRMLWVVIPTACYLALRYNVLGGRLHQKPGLTKTINVLVDAPPWQHALGVVQLWGMYWAKTFWPALLNVIYSINDLRLATSVFDGHVLVGLSVAVVLVLAAARSIKRKDWLIPVLILSLLAAYFPTSNSWVLMQVFFAERIWYLPSIFACMLIGIAFTALPARPVRDWVAVLLIVGMIGRCWIRNPEWKNNGALYAAAYRDSPNSVVAIFSHAMWLVSQGEYDEGIALLHKAIEIDLGYTDAYRILGRAYLETGQYAQAVHYLQVANMMAPGHKMTEGELARATEDLAASVGDRLKILQEKADAKPEDMAAQVELVRALRESGQINEALAMLAKQDARFASAAEWHHEYAVTLLYANRRDEGIERYARCVALDAENVMLIIEYAALLHDRREEGDLVKAQELVDRAAKLSPGAPVVLGLQAEQFALNGNIARAIELYRKAMTSLPAGNPQKAYFEERLKALGG